MIITISMVILIVSILAIIIGSIDGHEGIIFVGFMGVFLSVLFGFGVLGCNYGIEPIVDHRVSITEKHQFKNGTMIFMVEDQEIKSKDVKDYINFDEITHVIEKRWKNSYGYICTTKYVME